MTNKIEVNSGDDFLSVPVPHNERMGRFGLTMAWWALCSAMFWLMVPATLALTLGTKNVLIGLALSTAVYSLINGAITRFSIKTGLSSVIGALLLQGPAEVAGWSAPATAVIAAITYSIVKLRYLQSGSFIVNRTAD